MIKKLALILVTLAVLPIIFQNCGSDGVSFDGGAVAPSGVNGQGVTIDDLQDTIDQGDGDAPIVCNPLDPSQNCYSNEGLRGKLYYLTMADHGDIFQDNLRNANLADYRQFGFQVPVDIVMSDINITPRPWTDGFKVPGKGQVKNQSGEKLFEWFHIDLSGYIVLPAGRYQLKTLSDDGIRVWLDDQVVIENDTVHSPTHDCSRLINFDGQPKKIRVEYHQGPRTDIALVLQYRNESDYRANPNRCNNSEEFQLVPKEALKQVDNI